jgi:hypothetical protein
MTSRRFPKHWSTERIPAVTSSSMATARRSLMSMATMSSFSASVQN